MWLALWYWEVKEHRQGKHEGNFVGLHGPFSGGALEGEDG